MTYIDTLGQQAKVAGRQIAKLSTAAKNDLLNQVAKALVAESAYIITENARIWQMPRKMVFQRLCKIVCS